MAKLIGTSLLPPAFNQPEAGKLGCLLCTYTGAANSSQQLATSATFVIAAVGSSQTVTFAAAPNGSVLAANNFVQISDGTHTIIGQVVSGGNTTTPSIKTLVIQAGSAGNTMASAATVDQVASASFTLAAVGANNAIPFTDATQAALYSPGDAISVSDGTNTFTATVQSVAGGTVNATTSVISAGTAGNTVAQYATVTSTSGDRIFFSNDDLNFLPSGAIPISSQVIIPGSTASLAISVGFAAKDGDITTANATNYTYFNSATAAATAGRYNELTATAPVAVAKSAWPVLTISGENAPSATYTLRIYFTYPGPLAANR